MNTPEQDMIDHAMSYSLDDDEPEQVDELQRLLARLDRESRERTKRDCARMLMQLGCIPRSFVNQRLWL